mmetsp:Transcript_9777/g.9433  ORF Transcript_9777/g.9433 Transcript_9777/m.9433 type:complete len:105 (-) Transcript_9777:789-1103(-)
MKGNMKKSHRNRQTVVRVLLLLSLHSSGTAFVVTLPNRILPVLEEQRYCLSLSSSSPSSPSNFDSEQEQTQSVLRKDKDGKRNRKKRFFSGDAMGRSSRMGITR